MEAWFLSDIHLKNLEERNGKTLLRFLHSLREKDPRTTQLFLLGDIFDLWIGQGTFFANKFAPLAAILKELRQSGMKIMFIEGNHDVHIEGFFQKKLGIEVFVEAQYVEIDGLTLRLEHGDLINMDDEAYLKYRAIIRNPFLKPLHYFIPGRLFEYAGNKASKKSRGKSAHFRAKNEDKLVQMIRDHAPKVYAADKPFDAIISGHMHVFDDYKLEIGGKEIRSFNLGSWFEDSIKVLRLKDKKFTWEEI